jgi:hypothetical protein
MIQTEETSDREGGKEVENGRPQILERGARSERGLISPDRSARDRAWSCPRGAHHAWGEGLGEGRKEGGTSSGSGALREESSSNPNGRTGAEKAKLFARKPLEG